MALYFVVQCSTRTPAFIQHVHTVAAVQTAHSTMLLRVIHVRYRY